MAIDWSMRVKTVEIPVHRDLGGFFGSRQMRAMASTTSTGNLPEAVSANITASVPSSTALATSRLRRGSAPGCGSSIPSSGWR